MRAFDPRLDESTGIPNGLAFIESLLAAERAAEPLGLVLADVDGLLGLNAEHGQRGGDMVIAALAQALPRGGGLGGFRFGGDEFAVLVHGARAHEAASLAAEIQPRFAARCAAVGLVASCTVAWVCGEPAPDAVDLLCRADAAVRSAKADGGGRTVQAGVDGTPQRAARSVIRGLMRRMTQTLQVMQALHSQSVTDPVSGLPNHRHARSALATALWRAAAEGDAAALIFVDGDRLRRYNEIGYEAGNAMIRRLGAVQARLLPARATIARWLSGDEFLLVLSGTDGPAALDLARELCRAVRLQSRTWEIPVTISAGVAAYPADGADAEALLRAAYAACDAAKRAGGDRAEAARSPEPANGGATTV